MDSNSTGIKHFTTTTEGIGGIIKRRISDFVVREITEEGKTLEIGAFSDPETIKELNLEIPENADAEKEYLLIEMEKFGLDTNDALRRIARHLRCSPKRIGYGGMKDRRAITVQKISIWKPGIELLQGFRSRYVALKNPEWGKEKIAIGSLKGNNFEICVREISLDEEKLRETAERCFKEMLENGVANYFGEQRFGGIREVTHKVGKKFVEGKIDEAVLLYLTSPAEGEEEEIALARKNLADSMDFAAAVKEFPSKFRYERSIIHHLCRYPNDFVGAFKELPKHLTYLFTHAYQSYLFNEVINERIEQGLGLKPVKGDVVEERIATAPLYGFDSVPAKGKPGKIEKEVLERENLKLEDFRVKSFPELGCRGARKKMVLFPEKPEILSIAPDELNEGKLKLKVAFTLPKGNYATTILRELMKNGSM